MPDAPAYSEVLEVACESLHEAFCADSQIQHTAGMHLESATPILDALIEHGWLVVT